VILDLIILSLIVVFAVVGAYEGAARQLAHLVALGFGYLCAKPLGTSLGPRLGQALHVPIIFGVVLVMIVVFIGVMFSARLLLTSLLRRLLSGGNPEWRGLDRALGFALGGFKVALIAYFLVSALSFAEDNIALAGHRLGLSPKDSISFAFARQYNLFETFQYRPVRDLVEIAEALDNPAKAAKLRKDPAFRALKQDPRFDRTLADISMRKAIQTGDHGGLLRRDEVLKLLQTPNVPARLRAAAEAARD
jgi:membrane protein required for colicin V production